MNLSHEPTSRNRCDYPGLERFHSNFQPLYGYLGAIVCVISILTNGFNVFILNHKRMRTPTNLILLSLASLDIVICSVQLPVLIKFYIIDVRVLLYIGPWYKDWWWVFYYLVSTNVSLISHNTSAWLGASLAVFRYYLVRGCTISLVIRYRATQQKNRALIIVFASLLCNIVLIIPYLFTQTIKHISVAENSSNKSNESLYYQPSRYKKTPVLDFYSFWMVSIMDKIIPSLIMAIFIGALLHSMAINEERKRSLVFERLSTSNVTRKGQGNHHRATRLLVVIIIIILLAEIPHAFMQFLSKLHHSSYCIYTYLGDLIDLLTLCKNSITFVLYCTMSSDFRKIFTHYYLTLMCIQGNNFNWSRNDLEQQSSVNDFCTSFHNHLHVIPNYIKRKRYMSQPGLVSAKEKSNLIE